MTTILAVDVGNSRAKFGLFRVVDSAVPEPLAITAVPIESGVDLAAALLAWATLPTNASARCSIVSGSNPPVRDALLKAWPLKDSSCQLIDRHDQIPINVDVEEPDKVGIDRLLTGFAARRLAALEDSVIVVDSGTATTVNLITSDDTFRGGAILPGLRLSAHALHDYTARLPLVDTEQLSRAAALVDAPLPGRNTESAMKAGLFWGQLGSVRELTTRLASVAMTEFDATKVPQIVMTGGGGRQLVNHLPAAVYIDSLTLHGLAMLSD